MEKRKANVWLDLHDSVPEDRAPLFMMLLDNNGDKYYSIGARDGDVICHQTNMGDYDTFPIADVYGLEHIYYYYCNDIKLPDYGGIQGDDRKAQG